MIHQDVGLRSHDYSIRASGRAAAIFLMFLTVCRCRRCGEHSSSTASCPIARFLSSKTPDLGRMLMLTLWGLVPQQALRGYAAAAHASHTQCLGWLPTGFGAHHMRRSQRERHVQLLGNFPPTGFALANWICTPEFLQSIQNRIGWRPHPVPSGTQPIFCGGGQGDGRDHCGHAQTRWWSHESSLHPLRVASLRRTPSEGPIQH